MGKPKNQKANQKQEKEKIKLQADKRKKVTGRTKNNAKKSIAVLKLKVQKTPAASVVKKGKQASKILKDQTHNDTCFALTPDGQKILTYGYRILTNLEKSQYLFRIISVEKDSAATTIYTEFPIEALDVLSTFGTEVPLAVQAKFKKTLIRTEHIQVDIDSRNRKHYFVVLKDRSGNQVALESEEFMIFLQQKDDIYNDYQKFLIKKLEILQKFAALKELLAFSLNEKKQLDASSLKDVPKTVFNGTMQTLENLWVKLDKFV